MKTNFDIWKWLAPVVLLLAPACGHDELIDSEDHRDKDAVPYVELRIAIPAANPGSTRANPMGGEEGNGRERGILNEDKIHDINIFFYREDAGMNGAPETPIDYHFFFNLQHPEDQLNSKVDSIKEENTFYGERFLQLKFLYWKDGDVAQSKGLKFLAIANVGKLQSESFATLGTLRDIDFTKVGNTWTTTYDNYSRDASKMDYFLMSTAYNDEYKFGGRSTGSNTISYVNGNYTGTTTLQRMYARLDLWYASENEVMDGDKVSQLKYMADDSQNSVYITNVLPVNVMKKPSFLFKKVTDGISSFKYTDLTGLNANQYLWGGKESPSDGPEVGSPFVDLPQNYVIERHTADKTPEGSAGDVLETWYGKTKASTVKTDIQDSEKGNVRSYWHGLPNSTSSNDFAYERISVIGYANENTHPVDCYLSDYLTGMAFRAVYIPVSIYESYDAVSQTPLAMTEEQKAGFNVEGGKIYRYSPSRHKYIKESESLYFSSKDALVAYQKDHEEDGALVTEFDAARRTDGGELGFVCYYNLWLRHYNDESADPSKNYPMEYATVRNNIYRVKVSFTGPGDPTPSMREPDTMKARIFVRKWNFREEDTFYFD